MTFRHPLEIEIEGLRKQLEEVAERVRLNAVASAWLAGNHDIREGDYFLLNGDYPTKLASVSREGKWTYSDRAGCIEPFRIPDQADHDRLYTKAEVAEIVALATAPAKHTIKFDVVEDGIRMYVCTCGVRGNFSAMTDLDHAGMSIKTLVAP